MSGSAATLRARSHASAALLLTSSAIVVVAAVVFDLLAEEPPVHALAVGLVAVIVGVGRLRALGRHRGVFAAVNLVVVGQPAVHAVTKLTAFTAESMPHAYGWAESIPAVAVHIAVAMLVVAVAASEPAGRYVVSTVVLLLAQVQRSPAAPPAPSVVVPRRATVPRARARQLLFTRQVHRRGPPVAALAS